MYRINSIWRILISSLATIVTLNYLATGFIDFVFNIDALVNWLITPDTLGTVDSLITKIRLFIQGYWLYLIAGIYLLFWVKAQCKR
ncbi:MAG: hypothetical protein KME59_18945 [Trichormus sp. ATA11-4-KO1]|jgi:hypothetical protein|nr:hypothetical protein [Trichormus sp. ATA11-4-KO1]